MGKQLFTTTRLIERFGKVWSWKRKKNGSRRQTCEFRGAGYGEGSSRLGGRSERDQLSGLETRLSEFKFVN